MRAEPLHQQYFLKSSETAKDGARQAAEAYTAYAARVTELATHARAKSQELWQTYVQAARAAAVGDDASARTLAAYQDFQREYASLESEYLRSVGEAYSALSSSITGADSNLGLKMLDDFIVYLKELRTMAARDAPGDAQPNRG